MKVSVLMITYNHEQYIEEAIKGVLKQEVDFDIEFVISNDCSSDNTDTLISKLIANNTNDKITIKYFNNPKNVGMMPNFIFGLNQCMGEFIALCEGDDYWTDPLKLQNQVNFLESNRNYKMCFHRAQLLMNNKLQLHEIPHSINLDEVYYSDLLKTYNFITTASTVIRRPKNFNLPEWFKRVPYGDLGLYKIILQNNGKIGFIDKIMSVYRYNPEGMYSKISKIKQLENNLFFYKIIKKYCSKPEQEIISFKRIEVINYIAKLRGASSKLKQSIIKVYYNFKY